MRDNLRFSLGQAGLSHLVQAHAWVVTIGNILMIIWWWWFNCDDDGDTMEMLMRKVAIGGLLEWCWFQWKSWWCQIQREPEQRGTIMWDGKMDSAMKSCDPKSLSRKFLAASLIGIDSVSSSATVASVKSQIQRDGRKDICNHGSDTRYNFHHPLYFFMWI